jgi:hypothetical protein
MRFEDFAFERGGIEVALQDNTYGDGHWFEFEGDSYQPAAARQDRRRQGAQRGGPDYFALDPDHKRLIVDWFGTKPDRQSTKRATRRPWF